MADGHRCLMLQLGSSSLRRQPVHHRTPMSPFDLQQLQQHSQQLHRSVQGGQSCKDSLLIKKCNLGRFSQNALQNPVHVAPGRK